MSMVTYYARLSGTQVEELRSTAEGLQAIYKRPPIDGSLIDLDKASSVISWLLSPCKRAEQLRFAAEMNEMLKETPIAEADFPAVPPLDEFAIAIEGRGPRKDRALDAGLGPACIFEPDEVQRFSKALSAVDGIILRRALDFKLMDTLYLPLEYWEEEGEQIFSQYLLPLFAKLKQFYLDAANAGQLVLVWYN